MGNNVFFCSSAHGAYQLLHTDFRFLWSNSFLWINPELYLCFSPQVHTQSPAMSVKKSSSSYIVNISILRPPPHLSELPKCFKRETCVKPVLTLWFLSHKFALPFVKRWSLLKWPNCVFLYVYTCVNCKFSLFCKPGWVCGSESHALCVDFAVSGQKDPMRNILVFPSGHSTAGRQV